MRKTLFATIIIFSAAAMLKAQSDTLSPRQSLGGTFFLLYQANDELSRFEVKRAYLTYKANPVKNFGVRFTSDVVRTNSGLSLRLKYAYLKWKGKDTGFWNNLFVETGLVHRTWLSFEEELNPYRVLGYMFVEKMNIVNSADLGIKAGGNIGEKVDGHRYQHGKYGDWAIGVYNGGGYSVAETNKNKVMEARLTLRPLPGFLPGLLVTTAGAYGKNVMPDFTAGDTDFWYATMMLSYDSKFFVVNTQLISGLGGYNTVNYYISQTVEPYKYYGGSVFYDLNFGKFHQFSRVDFLRINGSEQLIAYGGFAYELNKAVFLVSSYERYLTTNNYLFQIGAKINF